MSIITSGLKSPEDTSLLTPSILNVGFTRSFARIIPNLISFFLFRSSERGTSDEKVFTSETHIHLSDDSL